MADKKISQLTASTTPLAGTEILPIVQSGSTVKVAVSDLTAGRAVSAASLTLTSSALPIASGGTNATSFNAPSSSINGLVYYNGTSLVNDATTSDVGYNSSTNTFYSANLICAGDATFDTSTLKVDATNNRVGVGTASPSYLLHVYNGGGNATIGLNYGTSTTGLIQGFSAGLDLQALGTNSYMTFSANGALRATILAGGDFCVGTNTYIGASTGGIHVLTPGSSGEQIRIRCTNATAGYYWRQSVDSVNTMYIINQATTGVYIGNGNTSWTGISDQRLKNVDSNIENAVESLSKLSTIKFNWKSEENGKLHLGLLAQEVQELFPEVIDEDKDGYLGVRYSDLIPVLIKAIKELQEQINELKTVAA